jgi:hypothetical protein
MLTACASTPLLSISDADSQAVYGTWPVTEGEEFSIEFVHSVNNTPVIDTFRISGADIRSVSTRFYGFGAGMQTDLEPGEHLEQDGDALVITGMNRKFRQLNFIVGTVSDHLLTIQGDIISLRDLCGRNAHITVKIIR